MSKQVEHTLVPNRTGPVVQRSERPGLAHLSEIIYEILSQFGQRSSCDVVWCIV